MSQASSPALRFSVHRLADLPEAAQQDLARYRDAGSPFASLPWFLNLQHYGQVIEGEVVYVLAHDHSGTVACLPLLHCHEQPPTQLLKAFSNYYTSQFEPVQSPAHQGSAVAALGYFLSETGTQTDIIDFRPMDAESPFLREAEAALRRQGYWADRYFCFGNWYLDVAGRSYERYFKELPTKIRKNAPRERRRLEEKGMVVRIYSAPDGDLEQGIAAYDQVYNSSWKKPEPFPDFIPNLCRTAAQQGWLRLGVMTLGEEHIPVAAQLWLVKGDVAYIYKVAYVQEYAKQSVGTVLSCAMMEHVIDVDKVQQVDYGMGDDAYKREWMSHRREGFGLVAFNKRRWRGIAAAAKHFGGKVLRRLKERVAPSAAPADHH